MCATAAFSDMFEANGLSIDDIGAAGAGGFADPPEEPRRVASAREVARLFGQADAQNAYPRKVADFSDQDMRKRMMGVDNESDQVP
jgi:hypothetical protein